MSDEVVKSRGFAKWEIALIVGVGAAAVAGGVLLAYYALSRSRGSPTREGGTGELGTPSTATPSTGDGPKTENPATTSQNSLDRARAVKQQGNEFYKQQKFDEAIRCYEEAISVCPPSKKEDLAIFHQNLAAVYDMMASKTTDADLKTSYQNMVVENCTQAFELNPRYIKAMTRRLKVYEALGRTKEAILDVTRVLVLDQSQGASLSATVGKLLKDFGHSEAKKNFPNLGPLPPSKYLVKTYFETFCWNDDLSEVRLKELWCTRVKPKVMDQPPVEPPREDEFEGTADQSDTQDRSGDQEVDEYAGFAEDPFVRAAAAFREERYNDLLELLNEAVKNGNAVFKPHALLLRGAINSLWRQDQQALKDLQDVVNCRDLSPQMYTSALVKRGAIMAQLGEKEKCDTCITKALTIDSNCADAYIVRARISLESEEGKITEVVTQDLEKGQSLAPNSPLPFYLMASAYHRMASTQQSVQLLERARNKFEEAQQKFPNFCDGLLLYSMFLQDSNQVQQADAILNKAVKLEPDNPIAHFSLGLLSLMASQDFSKAVEYMETAIAKDSSCIQAYSTLATIEMQRGNSDRAMELYNSAITFARSETEMAQAYISREVVTAQNQACSEYGISSDELARRSMY